MPSLGEKYTKSHTTFSGVDLQAIFDDNTVLTISGISCSITREKAPVYTFGSATARSISRGKRGVAGSVIAMLFDRHALYSLFQDPRKWYYAHRNEVQWLRNPTNAANPTRVRANLKQNTLELGQTGQYGRAVTQTSNTDFYSVDENVTKFTAGASYSYLNADTPLDTTTANAGSIQPGQIVDGQAVTVRRSAVYADQLLPSDITMVTQNEYGQAAWASINAAEFINEGWGMSVDDITTEQQMTFIALHVEPWRPLDPATDERQNVGAQTGFGINSDGDILTDSDAGALNPIWAPFWSRDIDGEFKQSGSTDPITVATADDGRGIDEATAASGVTTPGKWASTTVTNPTSIP